MVKIFGAPVKSVLIRSALRELPAHATQTGSQPGSRLPAQRSVSNQPCRLLFCGCVARYIAGWPAYGSMQPPQQGRDAPDRLPSFFKPHYGFSASKREQPMDRTLWRREYLPAKRHARQTTVALSLRPADTIAQPAHGANNFRILGIVLDLFPQPFDMDIDGAGVTEVLISPDVVEQLLTCKDLIW